MMLVAVLIVDVLLAVFAAIGCTSALDQVLLLLLGFFGFVRQFAAI